MNVVGRGSLLAALMASAMAATPDAARAEKFSHPSGFSFDYPAGWMPMTTETLKDAAKALPPEVADWVSKNKADLGRVAAFVVRIAFADFVENVNVVVQDREIPARKDVADELAKALRKQFESTGSTVENIRGWIAKVGDVDAIMMDLQMKIPGLPMATRQRLMYLPGGGKTFAVTCTTRADAYKQYEPVFDGMLNSFRAPPPTQTGFDWGPVGKGAMSGAVIGGLVGGGVAVLALVVRKLGMGAS